MQESPGGEGGSKQSFIRGGSARRSNPLPLYAPFLKEKVLLSYTFHGKLYPFHIPPDLIEDEAGHFHRCSSIT